nr:hypothetical protein [Haloplanus aerogenes]
MLGLFRVADVGNIDAGVAEEPDFVPLVVPVGVHVPGFSDREIGVSVLEIAVVNVRTGSGSPQVRVVLGEELGICGVAYVVQGDTTGILGSAIVRQRGDIPVNFDIENFDARRVDIEVLLDVGREIDFSDDLRSTRITPVDNRHPVRSGRDVRVVPLDNCLVCLRYRCVAEQSESAVSAGVFRRGRNGPADRSERYANACT